MFFYSPVHIATFVVGFHVWLPVNLNCRCCHSIGFMFILDSVC